MRLQSYLKRNERERERENWFQVPDGHAESEIGRKQLTEIIIITNNCAE
jgi:hypothetical protein